jgi:hypothetical protein
VAKGKKRVKGLPPERAARVRTRLIQTEKCVVAVEVEMVIPADDPSEPCYEAEAVQLLREIRGSTPSAGRWPG